MKYITLIFVSFSLLSAYSQIRFHKVITSNGNPDSNNGAISNVILSNPVNNTYIGGGHAALAPFNTEMVYYGFDESGNLLWNDLIYSFGTNKFNRVLEVSPTSDGSFISTAKLSAAPSHLTETNQCSYYLKKFDQDRNTIWKKMYGTPGVHSIASTIQLEDLSYAAVGEFYNSMTTSSSTWFLKMDEFGDTIWSSFIDNSQGELLFENNFNEYKVISNVEYSGIPPGETQTYGWTSPNIFNLNSVGEVTSTKYIDTTKNIILKKGVKLNNGNIVCAGTIQYDITTGDFFAFLVSLDEFGDTLWTKSLGESHVFMDLIYHNDENVFYAGGRKFDMENGFYRPYIVKFDTFGNIIWEIEYNNIDGIIYGITQGLDEGVLATGFGGNSEGLTGTLLLKTDMDGYYSLLGIDEADKIDQNIIIYPNPVIDYTTIDLSDFDYSNLKLSIFNFDGRLVQELEFSNEKLIHLNMNSYSSGLYHMSLNFDSNSTVAKKIIKL